MNILFVLENYFPHIGGVEVVFQTLCEGLVKAGHRVDVVTHRMSGAKRSESVGGVKVHRVDCLRSRYLFAFLSLPMVLRLAKRADLIHTTTFSAAPPAWLAARVRGVPVVITIHEVWVGRWRELTDLGPLASAFHDMLERCIYLLTFDSYICVSDSTLHQLARVLPKASAQTIRNGIDYHHFDPKRHKEKAADVRKRLGIGKRFVVLGYGRPGASKGFEYLVKGFSRARLADAVLLLILSRDPAYQGRLERIRKLSSCLKDTVILHDPVPWKDLPGFILASDVVVIPSLAEGFGFSAAESCAMGKPVIASDTTSLPEVVSGRHLLIPPKDPDALARALALAREGKMDESEVKRFSWKDNIASTISLYMRILGKKKRA